MQLITVQKPGTFIYMLLAAAMLLMMASGALASPGSSEPAPAAASEQVGLTAGDTTLANLAEGALQHFRIERISLEQGLSQSSIYCILQDRAGFMWFGTEDGLNRYDGYDFTVYKHIPGNTNSLSLNYVWSLYQDQDGMLWIGTNGGGLDKFDPVTEQFTHYQHSSKRTSLAGDIVRAIYEDQQGALWVGMQDGGLDKLDRLTGSFTHYQHNPDNPYSLSSWTVLSIYEDREGALWVGTQGGGLDRLDRSTGRFTHYTNDPNNSDSLSNNTVNSIFEDRQGVLWVGTQGGGLNRFDRSAERFVHYRNNPDDPNSLSEGSVQSIYEDREGMLWIGTFGGGLDIFDRNAGQFIHYHSDINDSYGLSSNFIHSIYEDREGILWIGTHGSGLNKLVRSPFVNYRARPNDANSLSNNMVWSIRQDQRGSLWVGTQGGGLDRLDRSTGQFTHYQHDPHDAGSLSNNVVTAIYEGSNGLLWVGTNRGGIDKLDPATGRFVHYQVIPDIPPGSTNAPVMAIYQDREGTLWIGTNGEGLNRFDPVTERFIDPPLWACSPTCLSNDYVKAIYQDREGMLWVGTFGGGLNKIDLGKQQITRYTTDQDDPHSLSHNAVLSIYEDQSGRLWIGTGAGLNRFDRDKNTFTHYTEKEGLPNNVIYGILEDSQGRLWLSTNKGISRFSPQTGTFTNYDVNDGLQSNEFNGGACAKSSRGEMFFGGVNGLTAFYPESINRNAYIPPVVLTLLTQSGEDVETDRALESLQQVTLYWPNNFFGFEFATLSYAQPEKNQYAYMLEGLDKDWYYLGTKRFGRYTNLPGGTYTLKIKGSNNDGVWNEAGAALTITVIPPMWVTWWFRGIIALGLVVGALGGHRLRVRGIETRSRELEARIEQRTAELRQEVEQRSRAEEALRQSETEKAIVAERSRLARDLHDAISQTLFSASLIAEALPTSWKNDQAEGRQLLDELRRLTVGAMAEMRTLLLELRPAALIEANLGDLLRQLAEAAMGREGVPVTVTVEGQGELPSDAHIAMYRIAQEALNNVTKHACANQVAVSLRYITPHSFSTPCQPAQLQGEEDGHLARVELSVCDDGRGFDLAHVPADRLGLNIMRERAQAIGAELMVTSRPGHGTQIAAVWTRPLTTGQPATLNSEERV